LKKGENGRLVRERKAAAAEEKKADLFHGCDAHKCSLKPLPSPPKIWDSFSLRSSLAQRFLQDSLPPLQPCPWKQHGLGRKKSEKVIFFVFLFLFSFSPTNFSFQVIKITSKPKEESFGEKEKKRRKKKKTRKKERKKIPIWQAVFKT